MDYQYWLKTLAEQQTQTIAAHTLPNGEKVWVRKVGKHIPAWRYRLMDVAVRLFDLGALQPIPNVGGEAALDIECIRLSELAALEIPVPRLLARLPGCLMISNLGERHLGVELSRLTDLLPAWQEGLQAIADVHEKHACLSQAFARNMIRMENGRIGFIDFEDNPQAILPLNICQSRDWLCYLQSTIPLIKQRNQLAKSREIWQTFAVAMPLNVREPVEQALRKIMWLRHFQAAWLGSDTLRLAAMGEWFYGMPRR